ncbi:MAG TPA: Gfo/Idh/MocA family oxidoreductase, partial [Bacteroidales bacterium]|nr:Gfo/Idh/MocA family oxidoreductase [Bacteroidales bacterium]
ADIELIIVNTPDHTHYELTRQALQAGKHVVVEKPFTQTFTEAAELIEMAENNGLVLSVFQNRRWDGDFLTIGQVLQKKLLGRLTEFESHFDRFRNYVKEDTWKEDPATGTGTLYNLGSHMIDQALILFGMPEGVTADIRMMRPGAKVDDSFDLHLRYTGLKVVVRGGYLVREAGPRYILHGTEGSFLKWGLDPQEETLKQGNLPVGDNWGKEHQDDFGLLNTTIGDLHFRGRIETLPGNYSAYYDNIYRALRHGEALAVTARQGANVIRIIEAAYRSARERRTISI